MQPQHILQPKVKSESSERWKVPAFLLVMVLGLGTSAFALSLYAEPETLLEPVYFHTDTIGRIDKPVHAPRLPSQLPSEEPRYESVLPDAPEVATTARTGSATPAERQTSSRIVRAVVTPSVTKRRTEQTSKGSSDEGAGTCDEVACLIDSSDPCCSQYESVAQEDSVLAAHKPYRPERSDVMRTMRAIESDVLQCFDTHGESGLASVDFVIQPDGSVREVELSQGALAFRACIRGHMRTLSFEPLRAPFTMSFPFRK